ncbi:hypothetical protein CN918_32250 [Priestia megaterium]|nr:hypothetical protein CN918_32250 [Priestia megaterium]
MNPFDEDISLLITYLEKLQDGKQLSITEYVKLKKLLSIFYESVDITLQSMDYTKEFKVYH